MINKTHILKIQQIVRHVIVSKSVAHYAVRLVRAPVRKRPIGTTSSII